MSESPFDTAYAKIIVFDCDGVLVESSDIKTQAFEELFRDYPVHLDRIRQYHLDNEGISRYQKFEWIHDELLQIPLTKERAEELAGRFSELVIKAILSAPMVRGTKEVLDFLAASRTPMAVASGTPQQELEEVINERGLSHYFTEVHGSPNSKDQILRGLIDRWGFEPGEVMMVGDAGSDFRAAQEVGTQFFGREREGAATPWRGSEARFGDDLRHLLELLNPVSQGPNGDDGTRGPVVSYRNRRLVSGAGKKH